MMTEQPKALHLAQELIAGKWTPNILQNECALRERVADELRRLQSENASLRTGYDAARLEIESLQAQLAAIGAGGVEPLRKRECLHQIAEPDHFRGATKMVQASEPVVLPEPDAVLRFERSTAGKENEMPIVVSCNWLPDGEYKLYTEQQVRAMLATGGQAQAVPNGWREQFATEVYADLEAADNQDVPLEEYPARILKVLDSTVGPRHPVVIKWRNDAIEQCIAIARKYCRDPESHKYLKQDLEAMLTAEPAPQAQKGCNP